MGQTLIYNTLKFLLMLLIMTVGCKTKTENTKWLSPIVIDGVNIYPLNSLANEMKFNGSWTAPKFNKNKKFYREILAPGGELIFNVVKKERYSVMIQLTKSGDISVSIKNKSIKKKGKKLKFSLFPDDLEIGKNILKFNVKENQTLSIERVEIYPIRTGNFKKKNIFFTPCTIVYYLNPNCNNKITFKLNWNNDETLNAVINTKSEFKNINLKKKFKNGETYSLKSIDNSIQKISISILNDKRMKVKLIKSNIYNTKTSASNKIATNIRNAFDNKNLLIILLDAARADRFGVYGYTKNTTPNIDKLKNSLIFQNFYCEAAFTLASTGTLLTGLSPDQHGVLSPFFNSLSKKIITIPESFKDKGFYTGAISSNPFFGKSINYDQGFENFIELFENSQQILAGEFVKPFKKMLEDNEKKKFFIYLHIREPHASYKMPPPYLGKFQDVFKNQSNNINKFEKRIFSSTNYTNKDVDLISSLYDENLSYADSIVGEIIEILKKKKLFRNTITVILSDHGEGLNEHGLIGHNKVLYKEGLHIPLIINIPGLIISNKYKQLSYTSDLVVTLYDMFKIDFPYKKISSGQNLFTIPQNRKRISRSVPYIHKYSTFMVESPPYRMIFSPSINEDELLLFDTSKDPFEKNNIKSKTLVKALLLFQLRNYLNNTNVISTPNKVQLREKDIKNLKSLGYVK